MVKSPFTDIKNAKLEKTISRDIIIELYKSQLSIDVSNYFSETDYIYVYRCPVSGYRFYYPATLQGMSSLYEQLERFEWYYMHFKWEYVEALRYFNEGDHILEVGCGGGDFLKLVEKKNCSGLGLEINPKSLEKGKVLGVNIEQDDIVSFVKTHTESFDVVCSFQVVEHIPEISAFLKAKIHCLKSGGLLIMSVPNTDSLLNRNLNENALNLPPHHMGLWNKDSLKKLPVIFNEIELVDILFEPLQEYHLNQYIFNFFKEYVDKYWGLRSLVYRTGIASWIKSRIEKKHWNIKGHTILAIYKKR